MTKIMAFQAKTIQNSFEGNYTQEKYSLVWDSEEDEDFFEEAYFEEAYILLRFFNTLADGIDRGVYDKPLIRINFEQDINLFYRHSGPYLRKLRFFADSDELFLPIEFLIKDWDSKKKKKKNVTYFG
jgi:hypothetical protein